MQYDDFISHKKTIHIFNGIIPESLNKNLFDFQSFIVDRSLRKGRHCIFADCGLGKTIMQLEWANQIVKQKNKSVLIVCPLAVSSQTILEGEKFGIEVKHINGFGEQGIYITNYEQLSNIDPDLFVGVVLDESSIIKNFTGKTKQRIIEMFSRTEFKLACTATPSPNDPMEMGNHAEFMGVMTRNEMLSMFFINDVKLQASKWRLKKHSVEQFYFWISEWATMISKPEDIGFHQDGFNLPALNFIEKTIETNQRNNGLLFNDIAISATNFNQELRQTQAERIKTAVEIANGSEDQFIVWVKHNDESLKVAKLINGAREVSGSDSSERKESLLLGFAKNEFRVLVTKSKIAQFGLNFQNCHNQIFMSLDFSFESLYQSIRRSYRFGQKEKVNIWLITTDTMQNVKKSIEIKSKNFELMQSKMSEAISRKITNKGDIVKMQPTNGQIETDNYKLYHGDCVQKIKTIKDDSLHYSFFSPPFSSLYTFSDNDKDMSNCKSHDQFFEHFGFLVPEIYRVLMPGRICSLHITQLTTQKTKDGYLSIIDFRGDIIRLFQKNGWIFHAEVSIWKDPELAAIRTKNIQLLHKQTKKDSCVSRMGLADYILSFRKPGDNPVPVNNNGNGMDFELWTKIASPIWLDIEAGDVLSGWRLGRNDKDERHITPTQLTIMKRLYLLYTNEGDTVFSPFSGIGSEGYQAILMNRDFIGIELKNEYYEQSKKSLVAATEKKKQNELVFLK